MKDNYNADVSHTDEFDRMYQEMVKQAEDKYKVKSEHPKTEEEIGLVDNLSSRWVNEFELPEGYIFKDENGNVINANKIVLEKKKKEYPKTYCECKDILGLWDIDDTERGFYKTDLIDKLQMLLICRDAYWKITGDEMGLGKPWSPDLTDKVNKHCIEFRDCGVCKVTYSYTSRIFAFPTKEIRDAFYENFKELIEFVKELL